MNSMKEVAQLLSLAYKWNVKREEGDFGVELELEIVDSV